MLEPLTERERSVSEAIQDRREELERAEMARLIREAKRVLRLVSQGITTDLGDIWVRKF